ncbi:MAG: porin family protein [Acidimicrobiia bacterium]|nr:porin family protein [Acidimicrobiia bacterium]
MWRVLPLLMICAPALAQQIVQVQAVGGYANFLDDSDQSHAVVGGSVRLPFSRGWAVEPEFLYLYRDRSDDDFLVQGNAVYTFGKSRKAEPYVVVGAGLLVHRTRLLNFGFTTISGTFSGGGGVRLFLSRRWFLSPEARIGWEPIVRVTAGFGYAFGR